MKCIETKSKKSPEMYATTPYKTATFGVTTNGLKLLYRPEMNYEG